MNVDVSRTPNVSPAMHPWHVEFLLAPRATGARRVPGGSPVQGEARAWTPERPLPADFQRRVQALELLPPADGAGDDRRWGREEGNRVDIMRAGSGVTTVRVAVDTRQLDAKFAAALLALVRAVNGVLVRADGLVIDGTVGAFSAALRSAPAWRFVRDPTGLLTGKPAQNDAIDADHESQR